MRKKLPLGISDFKQVVQDFHYVDKSLFIRDIVEAGAQILLFPRPRRFGKTLNITMLRYFFEKSAEDHRGLFEGLAIERFPENMEKQGRYPVIFLSFKDTKQATFRDCFRQVRAELAREFQRHAAQIEPAILNENEKAEMKRILNKESDAAETEPALRLMCEWLHRATGEKVVLLIDEYDTPIHAAYTGDYFDEGALFIRNLLGAALKDNVSLEKGVLTGILRVARESLFSGLNNLSVYGIFSNRFADNFGFTEPEVERLFQDCEQPQENLEGARRWYNGYRFGETVVYNPWSVLSYLDNPADGFKPYWINTSSNDLIRDLVINGSPELHADLEILLCGGTIESMVDEHVSLRDLDADLRAVWSLMLQAGYLKTVHMRVEEPFRFYGLSVPNEEVRLFFNICIRAWLDRTMNDQRLRQLLSALTAGDIKMFGRFLRDLVADVLSVHDVAGDKPERVYHAFTLGLLVNLGNRYRVESNRESGYGRYDVMLISKSAHDPGLVLEFKKFDEEDEADEKEGLASGLKQIRDKGYASRLRAAGSVDNLGVAILFKGKRVFVESERLE